MTGLTGLTGLLENSVLALPISDSPSLPDAAGRPRGLLTQSFRPTTPPASWKRPVAAMAAFTSSSKNGVSTARAVPHSPFCILHSAFCIAMPHRTGAGIVTQVAAWHKARSALASRTSPEETKRTLSPGATCSARSRQRAVSKVKFESRDSAKRDGRGCMPIWEMWKSRRNTRPSSGMFKSSVATARSANNPLRPPDLQNSEPPRSESNSLPLLTRRRAGVAQK